MDKNTKLTYTLPANNFLIEVIESKNTDWIELQTSRTNSRPIKLGGQNHGILIYNIQKALHRESGRKLESIQNARFSDLVGGGGTEYLGNAPLDGYVTIYFFRDTSDAFHLVIADAEGDLINHSVFDKNEWLARIFAASNDGQDNPKQTGD